MFSNDQQKQSTYLNLVKLTYLGWLGYFIVFNLYAAVWRQYATEIEYNFVNSLIWFAKEWGAWLLLSPAILWFLTKPIFDAELWINILTAGLFSVCAMIIARGLLNQGEYPQAWLSVAVIILPKYCMAYLVLLSGWFFVTKQTTRNLQGSEPEGLAKNHTSPLNIVHQGVTMSIQPAEIFSLKAAGNYIEIECAESTYLMRATLKELLSQLPEENFVRVHRSYVINTQKLLRLTNTENGGGTAVLSNESSVPVSKRYKSLLKAQTIPRF